MRPENKGLLKYVACFGIASLIVFLCYLPWRNEHILAGLSNGFFVSGVLFLSIAGMLYISSEGGFIGISFVLHSVVQWFVPLARKNHESYAKFRERKLGQNSKPVDFAILITGIIFMLVGIILTIVWNSKVPVA
ncbi:MAG: DUF3899 domain-containing protein [Clostridia bacterium]|nr:DUF3899 domain-containing protein [Clostridia bacterium]